MLSAIAARKAAAAASSIAGPDSSAPVTQLNNSTLASSVIGHQSSSSSKQTPSLSSKRKRSQVALSDISTPLQPSTASALLSSVSAKKRRKKDTLSKKNQKPPRHAKPRYFELQDQAAVAATSEDDSFHRQDDVIVLERDGNDGEDWDNSDIEIVENAMEEAATKMKVTRGYSPSQPIALDDSEEEEREDEGQQNGSSVQPELLTTLVPIPRQNTFYLTTEEVASVLSSKATTPGTLVAFNSSETLTLLGTYRLSVIRGSIQIGGAILHSKIKPESHNVFAPRSSPLPCIRALNSSSSSSSASLPVEIQNVIGNSILLLQELHTGVEGLGKVCRTFDTVFSLHPRDALNRQDAGDQDVLRLKGVRIINHQSKYISPLDVPSSWERALNEVYISTSDSLEDAINGEDQGSQFPPNIYLVKGPKKVGKSSFARALMNRLLSRHHRIAYLDLDPGQSEFTPGALLALSIISNPIFGPPFTHPTIPVRSHFLGAFTPKTSPGLYMEGLKDLVKFWAGEVGWGTGQHQQRDGKAVTIPLVVNTMGWTKGLGADLMMNVQDALLDGLAQLSFEASLVFGSRTGLSKEETDDKLATLHLYEFEPSQVVYQMQPLPAPLDTYSFFGHAITSTSASYISTFRTPPIQTHRIDPAPISGSPEVASYINNFSAADHRAMNIMSYFHAVFPSSSSKLHVPYSLASVTASYWDTSLPLLAHPPYQVNVGYALDRVFLRGVGEAGEVVQEEIERVLGGAVVALIQCEPGVLDELTQSKATKIPYFPSVAPASYPSPTNSTAIGLALVRSVAPGGSHLHVLTPLPLNTIAAARVMIKGEMELPIWGMVDFRSIGSRKERRSGGGEDDDVQRDTPFLQWDKAAGLGAEKRRVRRNLMRKGQGV
ncbi:hypothetical protein DFJ43DRAFT_1064020 [Lentinula guzmanii]|uniref:Polynucleotide 5'-hydroxyl-kinase GRC3 n=1 Tax=Lentinula guzmanii TaxID=2804957 RepID=A0AA38MVA0_9AGAR|nr:hypothetical protein DFJ43DRAFT_1064020 [Lentinula guzmanii]